MAGVGDIEGVDLRETLGQYPSESLTYLTANVAHQPTQLEIPLKPAEVIRPIHLLSDYHKLFQAYLLETTSLIGTTIRSILEAFYSHHPAGDYRLIFTKDCSQLLFVSPQRILRPTGPIPTLQLRTLSINPSNDYHTDLEVLNDIVLPPLNSLQSSFAKNVKRPFGRYRNQIEDTRRQEDWVD